MKPLQDLTQTRLLLRRMIAKGYLTIEDLDTPSPGWAENAKRFRIHHPNYRQHTYRNPLRDDEVPAVEPTSPRDITPASGPTPAEAPPLPVTLEADHPPTPTAAPLWEPIDIDSLPF